MGEKRKMGSKYLQAILKVQGMRAWTKKDEQPPFFYLAPTHTGMCFSLSVCYINLPVNPLDLNDPSTAAAAAPRDGGRDDDGRCRRERKVHERLLEKGTPPSMLLPGYNKTMDWLRDRWGNFWPLKPWKLRLLHASTSSFSLLPLLLSFPQQLVCLNFVSHSEN